LSEILFVAMQVSTLFFYVLLGFIGRKKKIITAEGDRTISNVIFNFTMPAMILTSMNFEASGQQIVNAWVCLFFSVGLVLLSYVFTIAVGAGLHLPQYYRRPFNLATIFANVAYMGFPVAYILFGPLGVYYAAMFSLGHNLLMFTLGVWLAQEQQQRHLDWRQIFNVNVVAIIVGFTLSLLNLHIPEIIYRSLESLGQATIPLAFMLVGSMLAETSLKSTFTNKIVYLITGMRLLIFPLLTLVVVLLLPGLDKTVRMLLILLMAMPTAAIPPTFARKYNSEYKLLSDGVTVSTLLSMLTIPLWAVLASC
jgi:predicted permease